MGLCLDFIKKKSVINKEVEIWRCNGNLFERRNFDSSKAPFIGTTWWLPPQWNNEIGAKVSFDSMLTALVNPRDQWYILTNL